VFIRGIKFRGDLLLVLLFHIRPDLTVFDMAAPVFDASTASLDAMNFTGADVGYFGE
jgi:hypothetical protein